MKTVFFDIDTQIDFLYPAGALYVPGAEKLIPAIARLNRHAVASGFALVSTACAHEENDPEFRQWPPHCVRGTVGQQKPAELMLGQAILEKQELDLFTSRETGPLLEDLAAERAVVYGVVTEYCVRFAALGLLARGMQVELVTDAIQSLDAVAGARFLKDFLARGGRLVSAGEAALPA